MKSILRAPAVLVACGIVALAGTARAEWPPLPRVVELAKDRAPAAKEANAQVAVAQSFQTWARLPWLTNPYVEFQATKGPSTKDLAFYSFMMIPIEVNGQRGARIDEADAMLRWRSTARDDVKARTAGDGVAFWGLTTTAVARVEQYGKAEADAKAETDYYAARLAAADSTLLEKSLADAELARYAQLKAEATIELLADKSQLETVLGIAVDAPPVASAEPPPLKIANVDAFVKRVLDGSPALKSLGHEASYWDAQSSRVAREANVPLNFIVNFGRTDLGEFQFGGGLSWNFPLTIRNQGAVAQANAQRDRAEMLKATFEPLLATRARSTWEQYAVGRAALDAVDANAIPAADRVVEYTQQGYKAGKVEYLHVLQARRDRAATYARRLDLLGTLWRKYGDMVALLGELP